MLFGLLGPQEPCAGVLRSLKDVAASEELGQGSYNVENTIQS